MIFHSTKIAGVFDVEIEKKEDDRGYFARVFAEEELAQQKIEFGINQINRSFNHKKGTLRGIHYQKEAMWESKLMFCMTGALFVVVVDLRPTSPTHKQWVSTEISADNKKQLLIPKGCANGFQTLVDNTEILYCMSEPYSFEHATGIHYKDPKFNIPWPLPISVISEKDDNLPMYEH